MRGILLAFRQSRLSVFPSAHRVEIGCRSAPIYIYIHIYIYIYILPPELSNVTIGFFRVLGQFGPVCSFAYK
jgi:hypothetical protein